MLIYNLYFVEKQLLIKIFYFLLVNEHADQRAQLGQLPRPAARRPHGRVQEPGDPQSDQRRLDHAQRLPEARQPKKSEFRVLFSL